MTEKEQLAQSLAGAGCGTEAVQGICALYQAGNYPEMLRQMKKQRCVLIDAMHESQQKVDRMDYLIRRQEKQIRQEETV